MLKCPICGEEVRNYKLYSHIMDSHRDYVELKCNEHGEDPNSQEVIDSLMYQFYRGNNDFEICPVCGHAVTGKTEKSHRRMCKYCGAVPQNIRWKAKMRKWLDSPEADEHREQARQLGKQYGKINGPENLKKYMEENPEKHSESCRKRGRINGPKNLYDYNHNEKYRDIRLERTQKAIAKRESNEEYLLKRAQRGEFNTTQRGSGEADLYIFKCIDPVHGHDICKVGYSRDFQRYRKWAYIDFNPSKVLICRLSGQQVLDFEQECLGKFNHYWMPNRGISGKSEWYWGAEYDKILELAGSKGYEFSEQEIHYN